MGNKNTSPVELRPEEVDEFSEKTSFSKDEIKNWHRTFHVRHPNGVCSKKEFKKTYGQLFPEGNSNKFSDYVFSTYDINKDGTIDFGETLNALKIMSKGTLEEKLKWAFDLFDTNKNGSISKSEMQDMLSSIFKMDKNLKDIKTIAVNETEKVFKMMDKDSDNKISEEEFFQVFKFDHYKNPSLSRLTQALNLILS